VFSAAYIDNDGEIIIDWTLNVLADGLHAEYVYDVLARANKLWRELWPVVSDELK
jgi:Mn-containing catalase